MIHRWKWMAGLVLAGALSGAGCNRPQPPTVRPTAARVTRVGPAAIDLEVQLDVHNPNSFPLAVQSVRGALEVGSGVEVGSGRASLAESIPARGSRVVDAEIKVGWTQLQALAPYALSPSSVPYRFRGTATIGSERLNVDVPFVLTGELSRAELLQAGLRGLGVSDP